MIDIFFSCDARDKLQVGLIGEAFVDLGYKVFWDQEPSQPDDVRWEEVRQRLERAKCVIVFWSLASITSKKVKQEATIAEQAGKLVQVLIEPLPIQELPPPFHAIQAAVLFDWQGDHADGNWIGFRGAVEAKVAQQREAEARIEELTGSEAARRCREAEPASVNFGSVLGAQIVTGGATFVNPLLTAGRLVENIPRRMRVGVSESVEIRVGREELTSLMTSGLIGTADPKTHAVHAVEIIESMTVRLFAPQGGFEIGGASPETQIVDAGGVSTAYGRWLWTVTPLRRGHHRIQICISAQVKTNDGLPAHSTLPDQIIEIEVAVNYKSVAVQAAVVSSGAMASAFLGAIASDKWPAIRDFVGALFGK